MNRICKCGGKIDRFSPGYAEYRFRKGMEPQFCSVECRVQNQAPRTERPVLGPKIVQASSSVISQKKGA